MKERTIYNKYSSQLVQLLFPQTLQHDLPKQCSENNRSLLMVNRIAVTYCDLPCVAVGFFI